MIIRSHVADRRYTHKHTCNFNVNALVAHETRAHYTHAHVLVNIQNANCRQKKSCFPGNDLFVIFFFFSFIFVNIHIILPLALSNYLVHRVHCCIVCSVYVYASPIHLV